MPAYAGISEKKKANDKEEKNGNERNEKMSILSVRENNFHEVENSEKTVLLDFYADWCGPCRRVSPLVEKIAKENPDFLVGKVNVDAQPELARRFGVMGIPTLVVLKGGKAVRQEVGAKSEEEILSMLKE